MTNAVTFQFAPGKIRGVALFAAVKDIRYYLNGVFFTRAPNGKGMIAVATDGHRLTVIYHEQDVSQVPVDFPGVIVPTTELLMAATKPAKLGRHGASADVAFIVDGGKVTMKSAVTVEVAAIEGRFPDYQRVIPPLKDHAKREQVLQAVNADYLADYPKLKRLVNPGVKYMPIAISTNGLDSSILVGIGEPDVVCVLMPMRDAETIPSAEWLESGK